MKTRQIEDAIKNSGFEKAIKHAVEGHNEELRELRKIVGELAQQQMQMIDTLHNVVNGAGAMKQEMIKQLKQAGLYKEDDGLGVSTQSIGEDQE